MAALPNLLAALFCLPLLEVTAPLLGVELTCIKAARLREARGGLGLPELLLVVLAAEEALPDRDLALPVEVER